MAGYRSPVSEPRILHDRYEIGDLLGAGGSSRVYEGMDRVLERRVAIKVLDRSLAESTDPAAHERFLREARSAARFMHTNAVATYDAGEDGDTLFIVMEFVEGTSLAHVIHDQAPIGDDRVVDIAEQLLSALGAAHAAGIVHRDVKPANILVTASGDVKLADFGIARRFDEITNSLTAEGMVIGTREYLAPEQARGLETTPATDLYAVGAVLYELATGQRPPTAPPVGGADPRRVRPEVGPNLAATIATATAADPAARFASADAMRTALTSHLPPTQLSIADTLPTPVPAVAAGAPTAVMGQAPAPETSVMGHGRSPETAVMSPAPVHDRPDLGRRWLAGVAALAVAAFGLVAWAASDGRDGTAASAPTFATTAADTEPAATTLVVTTPPTTTPTTPADTPPPTNAAQVTTPPTAPPAPAELVPGFPDTNDIDQFIEQLRDAKEVAGKQAKKLSDKMRVVLDEDDDERGEKIDKLFDEIEEWVEKEELDPVIARRAVELIGQVEVDRDQDDD